MHADCRAQSRCDKCSAPFASSAALAKHKRFCDAASSTLKAHIESDSRSNFSERSSTMFSLRSTVTGVPVLPIKELDVVRSAGEISTLTIKNREGDLELNALTTTSISNNNGKCEMGRRNASPRQSNSGNTSTYSSESNSARSSPGAVRFLGKVEENVSDGASGKLMSAFPAGLMFPQTSPTLYSPFTSMAIYPQLFAPRNHLNRVAEKGHDHRGKRGIISSLSPMADQVIDRENKTMLTSCSGKEQNNNETGGDETPEEVRQPEENKQPKKADTPLDLSVQKHPEYETSERKAKILRCESFKDEDGTKNRKNSKPQQFHKNTTNKLAEDNSDFIPTRGAMTRCKDLQISSLALPPHLPPNTHPHQLLDEFVMSIESNGVSKPGNLSSIIAPRPLHPYSRFPLASSHHLTALHAGFHPSHFSPFIHNSLSPQNDLSNNLAATSPTWQSKVGNR